MQSASNVAGAIPVKQQGQEQLDTARGQPSQPQPQAWVSDPIFDELARFGGLLQPRGPGGGIGGLLGGGNGGDLTRMFTLMDDMLGRYPGFAVPASASYGNLNRAFGGGFPQQQQQQGQLGNDAAAAQQSAVLAPFGYGYGGGQLQAPPQQQQPLALPAAFTGPHALRMDVAEDEAGYTVHVDVPGVDKGDITVTVDAAAGTLRVAACACAAREDGATSRGGGGGMTWRVVERASGSGARVLRLPRDVDAGAIGAACVEHGVLRVRLPKALPVAQQAEAMAAQQAKPTTASAASTRRVDVQ
jgi:HSP20 family molecular chaperone IbpA